MNEKVNTIATPAAPVETAKIEEKKPAPEKKEPEPIVNPPRNEVKQAKLTLPADDNNRSTIKEKLFSASQIQLIPISIKSSGKEMATTKSNKTDVMRIDFNISELKTVSTGTKSFIICLYNPDDKLIMLDEKGWSTFVTSEGEEKVYSSKIVVNYIQGQTQNVSIDWRQHDKYEPGTYRIEIYHNGFLIGKGSVQLRKATGIFG